MTTANDIKNGLCIEFNDNLFFVTEFQHVKPGKGPAFVRTKLKNAKTGKVIDNTFPSGHKIITARVEKRTHQFQYKDGENYHFMDQVSYEQILIKKSKIGEKGKLLKENTEVTINFYDDSPLSVDLPITINCKIIRTDASLKGQTVSSSYKPAIIENDVKIQVPPFIDIDLSLIHI